MVTKETPLGGFAAARGTVFELSGGRLCLDFVNTVEKRPSAEARDLLETYAELVSWSRQSGILAPREAGKLLLSAGRRAAAARGALGRARGLRETLYVVFSAHASGRKVPSKPLAALQAWLPKAYRRPEIRGKRAFGLVWRDDLARFDGLLSPIVRSAMDLLAAEEIDRVRQCAADGCAWLFLDQSKNRSRQWCDMTVCGNRAKARRFHARKRAATRRRGIRARRPSGETR